MLGFSSRPFKFVADWAFVHGKGHIPAWHYMNHPGKGLKPNVSLAIEKDGEQENIVFRIKRGITATEKTELLFEYQDVPFVSFDISNSNVFNRL